MFRYRKYVFENNVIETYVVERKIISDIAEIWWPIRSFFNEDEAEEYVDMLIDSEGIIN